MTCTHAALIRRRLVELGFKFDNMVMEESAQILEVETFIPMMLQVTISQHHDMMHRRVLPSDCCDRSVSGCSTAALLRHLVVFR